MSYVLAAVFFTLSGTTVTIQKQQNVASVVRNATGQFTIAYTSNLANTNYGVLAQGRLPDSTTDQTMVVSPNRNTSTHAAYSTSAVDVLCQIAGGANTDPVNCCVIVFDASVSASDILAAGMGTLSGTTITLQKQTGLSGVTRRSAGQYEFGFSPSLSDGDYSFFSGSRYADFAGDAVPLEGQNRDSTGPNNLHTTSAFSQLCGLLNAGGGSSFDVGLFCGLARNADAAAPGVLAAVRFSISGGACTIIKQNNVSSVTYQAAGCYRVNINSALASANYGVICQGSWTGSAGLTSTPAVGPNRNSSSSRNAYSTSALDVTVKDAFGSTFDVDTVDVWIVDPSLLGSSAAVALAGMIRSSSSSRAAISSAANISGQTRSIGTMQTPSAGSAHVAGSVKAQASARATASGSVGLTGQTKTQAGAAGGMIPVVFLAALTRASTALSAAASGAASLTGRAKTQASASASQTASANLTGATKSAASGRGILEAIVSLSGSVQTAAKASAAPTVRVFLAGTTRAASSLAAGFTQLVHLAGTVQAMASLAAGVKPSATKARVTTSDAPQGRVSSSDRALGGAAVDDHALGHVKAEDDG